MAVINFEEGIDAYVKAHQKVWKHDRSKSIGASEAFGCMRKSFFGKKGYEKDPNHSESWGALQRGDLIENHFAEPSIKWFLENLFQNGRLIWGGTGQRTFQSKDAPLSATPDGLVVGADDDALAHYGIASLGGTGCFNLEIKSIDPRVNLREEKAIHRGQTIIQMGLTRENTRYQPNYAVIIYIDASFFDDIDIFIVPFDQATFDIAKQRAHFVFNTTNASEVPAEGKYEGGCDFCPFKVACAQTNMIATPQEGEMNSRDAPLEIMEEFESIVLEERAASQRKKLSERDHKEAAEKLKQWFRDVGVRRAEVQGVVKASISWIKGRKTYDIEAMRADGIDVEQYARMSEGHDRVNISENGGRSANED